MPLKKLTSDVKTSETPNTIPNEEYDKSNCDDISWEFLNESLKINTYCSHLVKIAFYREIQIIAHLDICLRDGAIILNTYLWFLVSKK